MSDDNLWQTKLHARLHDPAEKALVLLRDPAGHEGGTSEVLHRLLGFGRIGSDSVDSGDAGSPHRALFRHGVPRSIYDIVQRADWWAAAADRPQWPMQEITVPTRSGQATTFMIAPWAQVRWTKQPVLIHPLTGAEHSLGSLADTDFEDIKARSYAHAEGLVQRNGDAVDWCRTLLALWRFGPEVRESAADDRIGALWHLLPADTRVPDHSIWDHLDLVSAFAGAFASDAEGEAALLAVSLGPVQGFIDAARSTSDLWAGSHLLARLAWEAMKPVCEALGPDAIVFPRLRGVPQVDLWLRDDCGVSAALFEGCDWLRGATDANSLFSASLPNRFVALVPRSGAEALARQVEKAVCDWLQTLGHEVVERLLAEAGLAGRGEQHCHRQMREQLRGFPEVHWAAVPFSLVRASDAGRQAGLDTAALSEAMAPFFGADAGRRCGFLDSPAWAVLQKETASTGGGTAFFTPNPGVLYPAIHELAERVLAAAKATRPFEPADQGGWRCTLTGETEWLAVDAAQLALSAGQRQDTLWQRVAGARPAWAKQGEHLGALPAVKRLWPTLFAEEVGRALGCGVRRFVVSTHTMALAAQLDRWLADGSRLAPALVAEIERRRLEPVALPPRLMRNHARNPALAEARLLPALLDAADEAEADDDAASRSLAQLVKQALRGSGDDDTRLETYYAMLMLDGDHMGAWLSGGDEHAITYRDSFHPQVRAGFDRLAADHPDIGRYGRQKRALSPNRHLSISAALNDFSLRVARHVIEQEHRGRLIYAGGDDVLAMLPVADLLPAMQRLRVAYSGHDAAPAAASGGDRLRLKDGFALLDGRLMRMMGGRATASAGAVIAHHKAPLAAVRRELRLAEQRAKNEGGRDAFSLTVVKRTGGALRLTAKWGEPVALLAALRDFLSDAEVSRRAVYNSLEWIRDLPAPRPGDALLERMLAWQLDRQAGAGAGRRHDVPELARRLAALAVVQGGQGGQGLPWLSNFLSVAEFLARESRTGA